MEYNAPSLAARCWQCSAFNHLISLQSQNQKHPCMHFPKRNFTSFDTNCSKSCIKYNRPPKKSSSSHVSTRIACIKSNRPPK
eukprot:12881286-Prorocentrum_lima.AAC.1